MRRRTIVATIYTVMYVSLSVYLKYSIFFIEVFPYLDSYEEDLKFGFWKMT